MNKTRIKWAVLTLILLIISIGSYMLFERMSDNENAANTDLRKLIPENCDAFFVFKNVDQVDELERNAVVKRYIENKEDNSILKMLRNMRKRYPNYFASNNENLNHELTISFHSWEDNQAELLLFKMMDNDQAKIEELIKSYFKTSFEPNVEKNAGIKVYHYNVSTGLLFHCFYYKGIFAASFDNRLIDQTIVHLKNGNFRAYDPDFIDIANSNEANNSYQFYLRLNRIPLLYAKDANRVDTLNLCEWVSPTFEFGSNSLTMSSTTSPQFEKQNFLSTLIGQNVSRPLNPEVISDKCEFCIHLGLSDRLRYMHNIDQLRFNSETVPTDSDRIKLTIDSIFDLHFDGEINLAYFPVMIPEKQLQKVVTIRLRDEAQFIEKMKRLIPDPMPINKKATPMAFVDKPLSDSLLISFFGPLFALNSQEIHADLFENYLVLSARPEVVTAYIKELTAEHNLHNSLWYSNISNTISSKSNLIFIGNSGPMLNDRYLYPFGLPRFFVNNPILFKNSEFCFQFNTEESFIQSKLTIKLSDL